MGAGNEMEFETTNFNKKYMKEDDLVDLMKLNDVRFMASRVNKKTKGGKSPYTLTFSDLLLLLLLS